MVRFQHYGLFQRRLPACRSLPRQAVNQVQTDVVETSLTGLAKSGFGLVGPMQPTYCSQHCVIKTLYAQTQSVEALSPQRSQRFGSNGSRIGFDADFGQVADRQRQEFRHDREMLASAGRHVLPGQATFIDVTDWGDAVAEIEADAPVQALRITQYDFRSGDGGLGASETVAVQAAGHTLPIRAREDGVFRRVVGIHAWWPVERGYVSKLRVRSR